MSNWTVSQVYLYLLALFTLAILLFNFVSLTISIPDYLWPGPGWISDFSAEPGFESARSELFTRKYGVWPDSTEPEHMEKLAAIDQGEVNKLIEKVHIYFLRLARKS